MKCVIWGHFHSNDLVLGIVHLISLSRMIITVDVIICFEIIFPLPISSLATDSYLISFDSKDYLTDSVFSIPPAAILVLIPVSIN